MTDATITTRPRLGLALRSLLTADLQAILRSKQALILNLAVPIIMLILTNRAGRTAGAQGPISPGVEIGVALTFGLIASALMGYSITTARDREAGVFQRLRVTPAPTWAIMLSRLLVQFAAAIVATVVVIIAGAVIHRTTFSPDTYLLIFAVAICGAAMFLGIAQSIVGLIRNTMAVTAVGRAAFFVLIALGLLGLSGLLGNGLQHIADWTPVGVLITLFTSVQHLSTWSSTDTGSVLACAGYTLVFTSVGIRWFQWETS